MKKETIKGLTSIVDELISIRQDQHKKLQEQMNHSENELPHLRNQLRTNSERIQTYFKIRKEIQKTYQPDKQEYTEKDLEELEKLALDMYK